MEETYPSGRVVKNTLDVDGDLQQVQSSRCSNLTGTNATCTNSQPLQNYANSFNYTAAGAVSSMRLGNSKWESTTFNSRLQPTQIGLGSSSTSQNLLKLNYDYGTTDNNGNVKSQQITVPTVGSNTGFMANQNYVYDELNRLKSATENVTPNGGSSSQSWKQTFTFDRYGNRNFDTANTTTIPNGCAVAVCNPTVDSATNKLVGYQFDNAENTKVDANSQTFVYDSENKQVQVNNANGIVGQYFYDGDGERIKKVVPSTGETTVFVYDAAGKSIAEYSTVVADTANAKIAYLTNDHLGSPRITTDANGQTISRRDFMPFGEEIARANYGSDSVKQKFTGYERDNETDLDFAQARYYSKNLGRFYSVDPEGEGASEKEPQTWNGYSYAGNNPVIFTDPDGRDYRVCYDGGFCFNYTNDVFAAYTSSLPDGFGAYGNNKKGNICESGNCFATYTYFTTAEQDAVQALSGGKAQMFSVYFYDKLKLAGEIEFGLLAVPPGSGTVVDYLAGTVAREVATQAAPKIAGTIAKAASLEGRTLKVRPDIVVKGGRAGEKVKSVVSEANSVIKGSNGRVYVTNENGQIILDITRNRVKEVGVRGFVKKSERPPTAEEIELIKSIWK